MKQNIILISLCFTLFASTYTFSQQQQMNDPCIITIITDGQSEGKVTIYPYQQVRSRKEADSLTVKADIKAKKQIISLSGEKVARRIYINYNKKRYQVELFTAPGKYQISLKNDSIEVKGEAIHEEFAQLKKSFETDRFNKLRYKKELSEEQTSFMENYSKNLLAAIEKHPQSYPLVKLVYDQFWSVELEELNQIIQGFDTTLHHSYYLSYLIKRKENLEKLTIGAAAPAFTLQSDEGKTFSLSQFKGKYVLIDFWASWCLPCRKEIPNLKKIYQEFKPHNLEIISISTDSKIDSWRKAMEKEQMPWLQLIATEEVSSKYTIVAIPFLVLLDPEGKILTKGHFPGEELWIELEKFGFKKSE